MTEPPSQSGPEPAEPTGGRPPLPGPPPFGPPLPGPPSFGPPSFGYQPPPPGYRYVLPALAPDGRPLASFVDRLLARIIDSLILGAVSLLLVIPVLGVFFTQLPPSGGGRGPSDGFPTFVFVILGVEAGWLVLVLAATYLYEVEMLLRSGQTIGKRIMKIKIIPVQPGAPLTRRSAAMRWLVGNIAAGFVPFFNWLDGLWQLWDKPYQQCLHDKAASTVVVKLPQ